MSESPVTGIFVDAENIVDSNPSAWLQEVIAHGKRQGLLGPAIVKRAYAGWEKKFVRDERHKFEQEGFEIVDVETANNYVSNAADVHLAIDALAQSLRHSELNSVMLVTGDGGLVPLVRELQNNKMSVVGVGFEEATSQLLHRVCDEYVVLGRLPDNSRVPRSKLRASQTEWWEATVSEITHQLIEECQCPLHVTEIHRAVRECYGVKDLQEVAPFEKAIPSLAAGLAGSPYSAYVDERGFCFVDKTENVPRTATAFTAKADSTLPSFRSVDTMSAQTDSAPSMPVEADLGINEAPNVTRLLINPADLPT